MIEQLKTIRHHLEPLKNNSGVRKALTALSELEAMAGEQWLDERGYTLTPLHIADLEAENKRLREALQRIESMCAAPPNFSDATIQEVARAVLEKQHD